MTSSDTLQSDITLPQPLLRGQRQHSPDLFHALSQATNVLLKLQRTDGYWWFALEANESIGAEFIFLMHFLEKIDADILHGIAHRLRDVQRDDGTWSLYYQGPADLSVTIECYFALKLAGDDPVAPPMLKARDFILRHGGIEKARIFTRIHLALFGIVPWSACPKMPVEVMLLPEWFPLNIYEFSSWARASIVPLLIVLSKRPVQKISIDLEELFCHPPKKRRYGFKSLNGLISWDAIFIHLDRSMKAASKIPFKPMRQLAFEKAKKWIQDHLEQVEDIYPALAYAAIGLKSLEPSHDSPEMKKALEALKMFQQRYATLDLPRLPAEIKDDGVTPPSLLRVRGIDPKHDASEERGSKIHQQCCISPVWDTPWACVALAEAGLPKDHPALLHASRWLLKKQITYMHGDWSIKCPHVEPGGWSFEFENTYFPDVDDTIQVVHVLKKVKLPEKEVKPAIDRALTWMLAMQNDDGGWGAFDKNNNQELVNKIPFSDHGACLDPSSPDITGRMIELLATEGMSVSDDPVHRAIQYLVRTQEDFGGWFGRWGINYIYGTWAVLTGISALRKRSLSPLLRRGADWLKSIQHADGGFSESPESYVQKTYVPLTKSVPSQTSWAVMGLISAGEEASPEVERGVEYLLKNRNAEGMWDEKEYTCTGFPGHFYIRYHGYRHYFPLLALARYHEARFGIPSFS